VRFSYVESVSTGFDSAASNPERPSYRTRIGPAIRCMIDLIVRPEIE
jgi:hypothetical protein